MPTATFQTRKTEGRQERITEAIAAGKTREEITAAEGITMEALARWCKNRGMAEATAYLGTPPPHPRRECEVEDCTRYARSKSLRCLTHKLPAPPPPYRPPVFIAVAIRRDRDGRGALMVWRRPGLVTFHPWPAHLAMTESNAYPRRPYRRILV